MLEKVDEEVKLLDHLLHGMLPIKLSLAEESPSPSRTRQSTMDSEMFPAVPATGLLNDSQQSQTGWHTLTPILTGDLLASPGPIVEPALESRDYFNFHIQQSSALDLGNPGSSEATFPSQSQYSDTRTESLPTPLSALSQSPMEISAEQLELLDQLTAPKGSLSSIPTRESVHLIGTCLLTFSDMEIFMKVLQKRMEIRRRGDHSCQAPF